MAALIPFTTAYLCEGPALGGYPPPRAWTLGPRYTIHSI